MKYTVLGMPNCSFCTKAVDLLKEQGCEFEYNDIKEHRYLYTLMRVAGHNTVPLVFNEIGEHIGGYTELKEHLNA